MDPENIFEVVVPPNQAKERLDKFLTRFIGSVSRARLQKVIEEGLVLVDGQPAKSSHLVLPNQKIDVCIPKPQKVDILAEDIPLDIVYEDEHLLVVNKPAGMVVHPAFANYSGTLVNALMYYCGELSAVGGRQRPGIVHRLDKGTSGLMVVAKDDAAHQGLSKQFRDKTAQRVYQAVAWHRFRKRQGKIETYIARSPKNRKRMTVQSEGKLAVTNYAVLETFKFLSSVELRLETGRTHQIRVHLSYIGHSVLGDHEYAGRNRQIGSLSSQDDIQLAGELLEMIDRQALHAKTLAFTHPIKKELMRFDSHLPADMQELLNRLRG
ncbi:MAG: RluA family pseudouridine synthase [Calditrichaeota bacterium]|nr:RluA family pseudouridine synthase [Calditrichota bacterium]